jgi:putative endonuclease
MYYVYVLSSVSRNYIYVGLTGNLERRFSEHQLGKNKTTKPYGPFRLLYSEEFHTRSEAREREKYLKSGVGKEWIKVLLSKNNF